MDERRVFAGALAFLKAFLGFARWRAAMAAALMVLGAVFEGMGLLMLVPVLDVITAADGRGVGGRLTRVLLAPLEGRSQAEKLLALLGVFAGLMATRSLVLASRDRTINRLRLEFVDSLRMDLIGQLAAAPWRDVVRIKHVRIVQALGVELRQVGDAASAAMRGMVGLAMLAGYCVLALLLAPLAGLLAIACTLGAALLAHGHLRRGRRLGGAIVGAQADMTDRALVFLNGLKLAAAQGLQSRFVRDYETASSAATGDQLTFLGEQTRLANLTSMASGVIAAAALFVGIVAFRLEPAVMITLLLLLSRMTAPAMTLQLGVQEVLHNLPAFEMIRALAGELGRSTPSALAAPALVTPTRDNCALEFRNVAFGHVASPDAARQLDDVSLTIPAGAFVGVQGPSGSGKTTFLDLAAGLLSPQAGRICAFGLELVGPGLERHRARLAYVAQDPFLFDDTVRRNLLWSQDECPEPRMREVIELVGAGDLVRRLAQGLDSRIGERGALLSAGERQRLALARAILRGPELLILDEATNAIDIADERLILHGLASLAPRTTILMVAHRPDSLGQCDHLLQVPQYVLVAAAGPARALG